MSDDTQDRLRQLPAVNAVLDAPELATLEATREAVLAAVRAELDRAREAIRAGAPAPALDELARLTVARLRARAAPGYRRVVNATGVVVHTNLGRAPLAAEAVAQVGEVAGAYSNLEYDLERGARGQRATAVEGRICELTGAEAALVVNNNAAAVYLVLRRLAVGGEVVVSRGELVEIGGGFRIPDVLRASGAELCEVGTTNRTRLADYEAAITERTTLLLKVHRSNFAVVGFTEEVPLAGLAGLARDRGLPLVFDLGSGALIDLSPYGLRGEPTPVAALAAGADLVTFSGDKLLGGPQVGVIVGRAEVLEPFRREPMVRALRLDKMTLAALDATLRLVGERPDRVPVLGMLRASEAELHERALALAGRLSAAADQGYTLAVVEVVSRVGGGALPLAELPSRAVRVTHNELSAVRLEAALRRADPPVVARVADDTVLLDVRTLLPGDEEAVLAALRLAAGGEAG